MEAQKDIRVGLYSCPQRACPALAHLVHAVDYAELGYEEVEQRGSACHWAVLLACRHDAAPCLTGRGQPLADVLRRLLGGSQDVDQLCVVQQIARGV